MIFLDRTSETSLYEQLYCCISRDIFEGIYRQGESLPSVRVLAKEQNISLITVMNAYQALQADGYIYPVKGSGYYVGADMNKTTAFRKKVRTNANVSVIENRKSMIADFTVSSTAAEVFPWKKWRKYMNAAFDRLEIEKQNISLQYEKKILQESLKRYLRAYRGIDVDPEQIVVCSGTLCAVEKLARILTSLENGIAFAEPAPARIRNVFRANDFVVKPLNVNGDEMNMEELERSGCTSLFLPAEIIRGELNVKRKSTIEDIVTWMRTRQAYLIEFDMGLNKLMDISENDLNENIIYMGTFDEILPPEIQCAYLVLPNYLLNRYHCIYGRFEPMFPMSYQIALAHFVDDGYLFKMMRKVSYHNALKKQMFLKMAEQHMKEHFKLYHENYMESGIVIQLDTRLKQSDFLWELEQNGIFIMGANENWYYKKRAREDIFIFKFGCYTEEQLELVFQVMKKYLDKKQD